MRRHFGMHHHLNGIHKSPEMIEAEIRHIDKKIEIIDGMIEKSEFFLKLMMAMIVAAAAIPILAIIVMVIWKWVTK